AIMPAKSGYNSSRPPLGLYCQGGSLLRPATEPPYSKRLAREPTTRFLNVGEPETICPLRRMSDEIVSDCLDSAQFAARRPRIRGRDVLSPGRLCRGACSHTPADRGA